MRDSIFYPAVIYNSPAMTSERKKFGGVSSWPESEQPRERLLTLGANALSDAELVAILLRTGIPGLNVVEMARELLGRFNNSLKVMAESPQSALLEVKGLKTAKAAQLLAAMEIARRIAVDHGDTRAQISGTAAAAEYLRGRMRALPEEQFRILCLNRRGTLLSDELISRGDIAAVAVPLRRIMSRVLETNAGAIIAAHNHPSGDIAPSESDRILTKDIIAAARPLGVKVLDHIIIGSENHYSFADEGLLDELEFECMAPGAAERAPAFARKERQ